MHRYPDWVTPSNAHECAAPNCAMVDGSAYKGAVASSLGVAPRHPVHGSELCIHHERQLRRVLMDLAGRLPDVRAAVLRTQANDGGRGGASSTVPDPVSQLWNPRATVVATKVQDFSDYLVGTVLREYRSSTPDVAADHGALRVGLDARVALVALSRWYGDWLARYPGGVGPDILRSLLELRRSCEGAINGPSFRRVALDGARCREEVLELDAGVVHCEAPLVGILRRPSDKQPSEIVCTANPEHRRYSRDEWMTFAVDQGRPHG
ncbi:hypothetical protein [Microcella sp.]|uniref:hypothetical protein n=1 Tax=Microcella sp. TaxID=1913979 RepID=UPI00391898F4